MTDFGAEAQKAAEAHLEACQEAQWDDDGEETDGEGSPASAPFCGCNTCVVREVLFAGWPSLEKLARENALVDLADDETAPREARQWARIQITNWISELAADDVRPEQKDQNQSGGDGE